jgi:ADP-heptose:LPS heptosyltransferase
MHVAATTPIKIVSLHGHTLPQNSGCVSSKAIALCAGLDCSPCSFGACPNNMKCLSEITDEKIIQTCLKLIGDNNE